MSHQFINKLLMPYSKPKHERLLNKVGILTCLLTFKSTSSCMWNYRLAYSRSLSSELAPYRLAGEERKSVVKQKPMTSNPLSAISFPLKFSSQVFSFSFSYLLSFFECPATDAGIYNSFSSASPPPLSSKLTNG